MLRFNNRKKTVFYKQYKLDIQIKQNLVVVLYVDYKQKIQRKFITLYQIRFVIYYFVIVVMVIYF